ncbi:RNA polymerase sigma factor [Hyalangium minutum]|uniref:RNA polymerase sigma-70 factor, ECF subfamily protein n=1 Tax=Hyalangium minutum TaxID=394096 RepID=A0A085VYQ1_9BACT|nr:sigma-70 family RNA polymerase sigma factor [Hyalangium minutum]KFE60564.1 RNA polymerase sigma-70 factor, ECF subfamily protein [Hyalangium minutum]
MAWEWDPERLRRFRDGAPEVLGEVYRAHAEPLARALRSIAFRGRGFAHLQGALEVENTVLETFARAFEPRTRLAYDGVRPYAQFLMGIARNVVLEQSRTREVVAGLGPQDEGSTVDWELGAASSGGESLEQQLEDQEMEALLASFKEGLSPEERQLFELRFTEGLAQESAAERVGLTRIQVRRREKGLKQRLLDFLQSRGYLQNIQAKGWGFLKGRGEA